MRVRTTMLVIAGVGLVFGIGAGLRHRAQRFERLSFLSACEADRLEKSLLDPAMTDASAKQIVERVHWHDAASHAYGRAAERPWFPFEPDLPQIACQCGYHTALERPGLPRAAADPHQP